MLRECMKTMWYRISTPSTKEIGNALSCEILRHVWLFFTVVVVPDQSINPQSGLLDPTTGTLEQGKLEEEAYANFESQRSSLT